MSDFRLSRQDAKALQVALRAALRALMALLIKLQDYLDEGE